MKATNRHITCIDCGKEFAGHYNRKRCKPCAATAKVELRRKFLEKYLPATKQKRREYEQKRRQIPEVRESINRRARERHAENPERRRESSRMLYHQMTQEQRDRINERQRIRNKRPDVSLKNKERCKERYYKDHAKTLEATRQRFKAARSNATPEQKEKERERQRKWSRTPAGRAKSNRTNTMRKALKLSATTESTDPEKIKAIYNRCIDCAEREGEQYNVDHIIPLSRGGAHHQDNLRIIPASENFRKGCAIDLTLGGVWADNDLAKQTKLELGI